LSFPAAFLLPILLISIGSPRREPPTGHRARAALTAFAVEPSPEIEAVLSAERKRIIEDAQASAVKDEKVRAQLVAEAEQAAAIEADHVAAHAAADAQAERDAANARQAASQTQTRQAVAAPKVLATPKVAALTSGSGACGGNLPPCYVMNRESGGSLTVYNTEGSGAAGKWQFMPGTWAGYGGYASAADAPESVQDAKAADTWSGGSGCNHWNAC